MGLSPGEGLTGIGSRQQKERTHGSDMAEPEFAGQQGWSSLELNNTSAQLSLLIKVELCECQFFSSSFKAAVSARMRS